MIIVTFLLHTSLINHINVITKRLAQSNIESQSMPVEETTTQSAPMESAHLDPQFGLIEWFVQENRITLCPYLSKILALKTTDITHPYNEWMQLDHPDDVPQIDILRAKLFSGQTSYILYESRKLCRDGQWRWFRVRGKIIESDQSCKPLRSITICTEITKFKEEEQKLERMEILYSEVNRIKECNKNDPSFKNIASEILQSFKKLTHSSNALLIFSPVNYTNNHNSLSPPPLHDAENVDINNLGISLEKLNFTNKLFFTENYLIQNNQETSFLGINLNLPFKQKGMIIVEKNEFFDDELIEFLAPLIGAVTHIISIHKLEINRSELDNMLSFFIKQVPSPVAMFDSNMCYKFISEEWNKAFATNTSQGFIGKSHYDIFPDTPEIWRKRHQAAMRGEIQTYLDEKATHVSEKPIWVEGSIHPWYTVDGSIGGIFIYSKIVTDRIETEKNLKATVKNLSRSNEALERFAHVCSHDLKEPLRSVSNFIHLLFNANSEHFSEESMLYMRHILKGVDRMNFLIKDILNYSKIVGQSTGERTSLNMNDVIRKINDTFEYRFLEIGACLNVGSLPTIQGEPTQINQLFTNLISNSLKFHSDKLLIIDIFSIENEFSWEFHVRDNGIGIEKEYHKSIFTMFKRLHSKNQYEGSGIGLALCQKIIHEHLGEIYVESPPGGGSEFIFTFPKS